MADVKLMLFTPAVGSGLSAQTLYVSDLPGGASFSREHLNPVNARRTQDGTLITQTIRYTKKVFSLTITTYDVTLLTYFENIYESGYRTDFVVYNENSTTWAEQEEFNGTVQILSLNDDIDQISNIRTITMTLSEA